MHLGTHLIKHGVCNEQTTTSTDVQQQSTGQVQLEAGPSDYVLLGYTAATQVDIEDPQKNTGVSSWNT